MATNRRKMQTLGLVVGVAVGVLVVAFGAPALVLLAVLLILAATGRARRVAAVVASAGFTSFAVFTWSAFTCSGDARACAIGGGLVGLLACALLLGVVGLLLSMGRLAHGESHAPRAESNR